MHKVKQPLYIAETHRESIDLYRQPNMNTKPLNILIADDDEEDMELFEDALMRIDPDAELRKLNNGVQVIEYLANQPDNRLPCLIILDYNMPEMTGSEVLNVICKEIRYAQIPKLVLSTSTAPVFIHECMNSGATDYFVKPNNLHDLESLARKMLDYCKEN